MLDPKKLLAVDEAVMASMQPELRSLEVTSNPLAALDLYDLSEYQFKEREPLLTPWLHSQDLTMIHAGRGIGKTHLAIAIMYAVATGGTFAGWVAPKPTKVLYLDGELPGRVLQNRLSMHLPMRELQRGFVRVFTPDLLPDGVGLPDLSTVAGQDIVEAMIEDDTGLLIVDNLSAWCRTGRENDGESWNPIATWILQLRRRGVAVLMIHHSGKNGEQRGTSKKEDLLDAVIKLKRPAEYDPKNGAVFVLEFTKARNLSGDAAQSLELTLAGDENQVEWLCRTLEQSTYARVVALSKEGIDQIDIAEELQIHKSTVSRHLKAARAQGLIGGVP
jgi:putative DNA primase/helicase